MRFYLLLLLALPAQASEWVRVKLWSEDSKVFIIEGAVHRLQGQESPLQTVALPQKQNLTIRYDEGHWVIQGFKAQGQVITEKFLAIEGPELILNHKKIPAKIILNAQKNSVQVIGLLPLENYVMGVLAHEMPASWPLETLKAQAIATRSYSLAVLKERAEKPYHLESTVIDQVFGFLSDAELKQKYEKVVLAVEATQGQYLESEKKLMLKAYYHTDCGGQTATASEAWASSDALVSVGDSSCPQNPKARWNLKLSRAEVFKRLQRWAPEGAQQITQLKPIGLPGRLRVAQVEMTWDQGRPVTVEAPKFREAMGFFDFKSTQFKIMNEQPQWIFEGRGFGHGVGLCQWGSRFLGEQGWGFEKILSHYYPKAQLKILDSTLVSLKDRKQL